MSLEVMYYNNSNRQGNISLGKTEDLVYWPFYLGTKEEREILDKVHALSFLVVLILGISSHTYSLFKLCKSNKQNRRNKSYMIYKQMFCMDILILIFFIPLKIVWLVFLQNNWICKLTRLGGFAGFYGLTVLIIVMYIDRYFAILKPLVHRTAHYRTVLNILMGLTWIFSLCVGTWHGVFIHKVGFATEERDFVVCGVAGGIYVPYEAIINFIPLAFIIVTNISITLKIVIREKNIESSTKSSFKSFRGNSFHGDMQERMKMNKIKQIANMKTVKMTVVMGTLFTIFQIPAAVLYLLAWSTPATLEKIPPLFIEMLLAMGPAYIILIPILFHWSMKPSKYQRQSTRSNNTSYPLTL